ncbi:sugar ABC transporter substrate-binding protein [Nakamurella sp. A5-74]|uniref:Sugar ABC transporter substrate-binding protein n=1 Tax=Nakamurella sp. A5-74 TaxID=3158264 RepID=A0AAU8DUK3_9ACTN
MKFRKRVATCAVLLAAALALTGCGGGDSTSAQGSGPVEIRYWLWQDNPTDTTWNELATEFNASQQKVKVTVEVIPLDQYQDKLITAAANKAGPDAARSKDWWLGQFAPKGMVADLTADVDGWAGKADVTPALWATGQLPGDKKIYMLPHQYTTLYLYYRKDYFKEAGLAAPKSQQDVLDAAAKLTNGKRFGLDVRGGAGGQDQWAAWMLAGGGDFVDAGGAVSINNDAAKKANAFYVRLATDKLTPPGSVTAAFAQVKTNFTTGTTAMMIHHPGSLADVRSALGDKVGVVPLPTVDGAPGATLGSMSGNIVLSSSAKKAAAFQWISWLDTAGPMKKISTSSGGQLPVLASVAAQAPYTEDEALKVAVKAAETAKTWPALPGTAQLAAKDWQTIEQQAFLGQLSSDAAVDQIAGILDKK